MGFHGDSAGKESACNAGDLGLIPGLVRSPGEGNGYPLQYSGLEIPWTSLLMIGTGVLSARSKAPDLKTNLLTFKSECLN